MAKAKNGSATRATPQNINVRKHEEKNTEPKHTIEELKREVLSLKEKVQTKDWIIDDLFTELGKAGAAGEKWKEKYDCALRTIEETNQMMKNLEHERDELHKEITSLKDDANCLKEERSTAIF